MGINSGKGERKKKIRSTCSDLTDLYRVQVCDLVRIHEREAIPADGIILASSEENGKKAASFELLEVETDTHNLQVHALLTPATWTAKPTSSPENRCV